MKSRLLTILTGTRRLETGFEYTPDQLNFHDPKLLNTVVSLLGTSDAPKVLEHALKTNAKVGLAQEDFTDRNLYSNRIHQYGKNEIPVTPPKPLWRLIYEAMQDKVLIVLSVAAIVSLALGLYETFGQGDEYDSEGHKEPKVEWVEGVAIIVAIVIVVIVGSVNDYQKERQFAKLNAKKEDKQVIVIRDGKECVISVYEIVVGDMVRVQTGDILPADGVLYSGSCECDELALTGETNSIFKTPLDQALEVYLKQRDEVSLAGESPDIGSHDIPDPLLISGSRVLSGVGTYMVTAVGRKSIHGRTMMLLKVEPEVTPLQGRLDGLANGISKYGLIAAIILFVVLFIRFCALLPAPHRYSKLSGAQKGEKFLNILIVSITIVVVAVPEGLPLAVTLALAFATTRMAKDQNLVRVLKSCETMGGATAICSDKTGTLTENRMRVVRGLFGKDVEFNDTGLDDSHEKNDTLQTSKDLSEKKLVLPSLAQQFLINSILNSTAFETDVSNVPAPVPIKKSFFGKQKFAPPPPEPEPFTGLKTEVALLILCGQLFGIQPSEVGSLRKNPSLKFGVSEITQVIPFESSRKWSGIVVKLEDSEVPYRLYIKGAAEIVARKLSQLNTSEGPVTLSPELRQFVDTKIETYASRALRLICLAHIDLKEDITPDDDFFLLITAENGACVDAIFGIQDPLRPGVPEAVLACQQAGVTTRMVTGDNLMTGKAIALGCGIIRPAELNTENVCMEGPTFRKLSPQEMKRILPNLRVLARSSPEDKRILVQNLKEMGEVVAVTGDGTNDAPALKLANVGFSMGILGTDVAREASDIILMTDNFSAIVQAIKWGRCVLVSIKKFIQFQLTVNVTAVVLTFVSAVASAEGKSVLTAVQLLWVNLIMDTLAALALATDKPDENILKSKPNGTKTPLISCAMWKMIMGQLVVQLIVTFVLHFAGAKIFYNRPVTGHEQTMLDAMTFNTFVWLQITCMFVSRKLDEGDGISTVKGRLTARNLNFFEDIFRNYYFLVIMLIIIGFQILIMFVGGAAFSVARQTGAMWGTAIICGLLSFPAGWIIRLIPDEWVLKVFPQRAFKIILDILSLRFLRKKKKEREEMTSDTTTLDSEKKLASDAS